MILLFAIGLQLLLTGCGSSTLSVQTITSVIPASNRHPFSAVRRSATWSLSRYRAQDRYSATTLRVDHRCPPRRPIQLHAATGQAAWWLPTSQETTSWRWCAMTRETLLTLTVHADGSLSALGSVGGIPSPYPGIALDGTNVFIPLFGVSNAANGGVAKVSIACARQSGHYRHGSTGKPVVRRICKPLDT